MESWTCNVNVCASKISISGMTSYKIRKILKIKILEYAQKVQFLKNFRNQNGSLGKNMFYTTI